MRTSVYSPTSEFYLCPVCDSAAVTSPVLSGGEYTCDVCKWHGVDPFMVPVHSSFANGGAERFIEELLVAFSKSSALPIAKILVSWGIVARDEEGKPIVQELARYLRVMAHAMSLAVMGERYRAECRKAKEQYGQSAGQG